MLCLKETIDQLAMAVFDWHGHWLWRDDGHVFYLGH